MSGINQSRALAVHPPVFDLVYYTRILSLDKGVIPLPRRLS